MRNGTHSLILNYASGCCRLMAMSLRIDNAPAPLTATFRENVSPWNYLYLPMIAIFLALMGAHATPLIIGILLFYGFLFTAFPAGRGAIVEISEDDVVWKKTIFGFVWRTQRTTFGEIYTVRWIQSRWPWYSRYRIPSHILVKLNGGGHFKFASTIMPDEYRQLQDAISAGFPDLYRVTENAFEE